MLLDILATADNNVMKATEKLKAMGFEKRDTPPPRLTLKKKEEEEAKKAALEKEKAEMPKPTPPPRMKTLEEKGRSTYFDQLNAGSQLKNIISDSVFLLPVKARLEGLYNEIPERLIQIAMESVEFDEEKARQILMLMVNEEKENKPETTSGLITSKDSGVDLTDTPSKVSIYCFKKIVCKKKRKDTHRRSLNT